jgi:glycosyltransferase involved in cell wall biosynthesis
VTRKLRLALVSAYPPSRGPLSEYGWHLVQYLEHSERIEQVYILADRVPGSLTETAAKSRVIRCWSFGGAALPIAVVQQARRLNVDAIWFNLHLTSAGNTKLSRLAGIAAPVLARSAGFVTLVTLHNMIGLTDLTETRLNASPLDVWGAHVATRLLGAASMVCVPRPEYADLLRRRYGMHRVRYMPLGTQGTPLTTPPTISRQGLLAFGHFGSGKRLEHLIEAVAELSERRTDVHLRVGGSSSRYTPQYLEDLRRRHEGRGYVTFLGYVPEGEVSALFQNAAISVLPYGTVTGMSSVAVQSAMYGIPILASDIPGFRALEQEGLRLSFFEWRNKESLKQGIERILDSPADTRRQDALRNLEYCERQRMETIVDEYLNILESLVFDSGKAAAGGVR